MFKLPVLAGLFILALVSLPTCARSAGAVEDSFTLDARVTLRAYTAIVESHFEGVLGSAQTLAATRDVQSGDWERIKGPLAVYARGTPTAAAVWFMRPDGSYYTLEKGLTDQNVKDRPYFPHLMSGQDVEGDLVVSRSTGRKSVVIGAPVMKNGKVIGALGVSIAVEKLAAMIDARLKLPPDIVFYALDAQGRSALHRDSKLMFAFPSEMGSATLSDAVKEMLSKPEGVVRYEFRGSTRVVAFEASKPTGWVFALGLSSAPVAP